MSWPQARSNLDRTFYPRLQPGTALGQCMPMGHRANQNMYNGTIDTVTSTLSMRKKAAKRANARHGGRPWNRSGPSNRVADPRHAACARYFGTST